MTVWVKVYLFWPCLFLHNMVFCFHLFSPLLLCFSLSQTHMVHRSPSVRQYGCCGVWCSTTLCQCRTQRAPPVNSSCQCGPSLPSSSWLLTLPTWLPLWSRKSSWTKSLDCPTRRWGYTHMDMQRHTHTWETKHIHSQGCSCNGCQPCGQTGLSRECPWASTVQTLWP